MITRRVLRAMGAAPAMLALSAACASHVVRTRVNMHPARQEADEGLRSTRARPHLMVQRWREAAIHGIAFSPDGQWVVVGNALGIAALYDLKTGRRLREFAQSGWITSLAVAPDGESVVTGSAFGEVQAWEARTGTPLQSYVGHTAWVGSVAFSRDGRWLLASGSDGSARVWDAKSAESELVLGDAQREATSAALSPDGLWVAAGMSNGSLILQRIAPHESPEVLTAHSGSVQSVMFSPDSTQVVTASSDQTAALWDVAGRTRLASLTSHTKGVNSAVFSPDGRYVLTGSADAEMRMWEPSSGRELALKHDEPVEHVAFSPDGTIVLAQGLTSVRLIEVGSTFESILSGPSNTAQRSAAVWAFAFAPNSQRRLVGFSEGSAMLWERADRTYVEPFAGSTASVGALALSSNDGLLLTGNDDGTATLWDLQAGSPRRRFAPPTQAVGEDSISWLVGVAISPDSRTVIAAGSHAAYLWDTATGLEKQHFAAEGRVALSPDGRRVATGSDGAVRISNADSGAEVRHFGAAPEGLQGVAFSRDGLRLLVGNFGASVARLWDVRTGTELGGLDTGGIGTKSIALSPVNENLALTADRYGTVRLWDLQNMVEPVWSVRHPPAVTEVAFSPDGRVALTAGSDSTTRLWDIGTGKQVQHLEGPARVVTAAVASNDGKWVATADGAGNTVLWDRIRGQELLRLISFRNRGWVVIAPDGRFDTADLEDIPGLAWVMPDDPMHALPIEIFMRDYYEPRLLQRVLAGEALPAIRDLSTLDRQQPSVRLQEITLEASGATVCVKVAVETHALTSGMFDLHLFRDRQLVGFTAGPLRPASGDTKAVLEFPHIQLPQLVGVNAVEFSAYAFNRDGVKSATARTRFGLSERWPSRKGRAYVVTLGVNDYSNPVWNLEYAANDARLLGKALETHLTDSQQFEDVVWVPLIADDKDAYAAGATKEMLRAVLDRLAGREVDPALLRQIPHAQQLRQAHPEDLVLLSFSTHGFTDRKGTFYLFPQNIGANDGRAGRTLTQELLARTISSEDLSAWSRAVDTGEFVLVVDTCQSAGAVEGSGGFKPGPLGSRGLGQLAYNKGMRVLASTQAAETSIESRSLKQGLLTYALVTDGLDNGHADYEPKDGKIWLGEWLTYAAQRVPELYAAVSSSPSTEIKGMYPMDGHQKRWFQKPALFDFKKKDQSILLADRAP